MEVGFPDAQKAFLNTYQSLVDSLPNIKSAVDTVIFNAAKEELPDKVIYSLSRMVFEDFNEILLLCANGLSTGGMKILRGMFERTVTNCYLVKHPEKTRLFWNFFVVTRRKHIGLITQVFPNLLEQDFVDEVVSEYDKVKEDYEVTACKKCGTKRINFAWLPDNILTMAKEISGLEATILHCYYRPLEETHPSAGAIVRRVRLSGEDSLTFDFETKPNEDNHTLFSAHYLLLKSLDATMEHFKLDELREPLEHCVTDFARVWNIKAGNDLASNEINADSLDTHHD